MQKSVNMLCHEKIHKPFGIGQISTFTSRSAVITKPQNDLSVEDVPSHQAALGHFIEPDLRRGAHHLQ